jgi:hypothetical protein
MIRLLQFVNLSYYRAIEFLAAPRFYSFFLRPEVGAAYGVGLRAKLRLIRQFQRNVQKIPTASYWQEHLTMAAKILEIPPSLEGDVIECGCFKGGSTANLSLVCSLVGRKLIVCDSFEGLPPPDESETVHEEHFSNRVIAYEQGQYQGTLSEVQRNIREYGNIDVCEFVKGYFCDTLSSLDRPLVFAFVDVDLHKSLEDCLTAIWPRLQEGCYLFSHEAQDLDYIALFFDRAWWREKLHTEPPGFIGAGTGLPVVRIREGSFIGYTRKLGLARQPAMEVSAPQERTTAY